MLRRLTELPAWVGLILVVMSLALAAAVSTQLTDGWVEIPEHWWSTIVVGAPLGLAALVLGGRRLLR